MSIQSEITRIKGNVNTTLNTIAETGVSVGSGSDALPAAAAALANEKQDKLTFDTTPTSGSTNPVTSGGVKTALDGKLDKVSVDIRKEIAFGSSGKLFVGKFKIYDSQVTVDITATTNTTYSGKLVVATQNYVIQNVSVYGDAANSIAPNIYIKPSTTSDPYIDIYFSPSSWSKNVIHIYGNAIQATSNVCTSVSAIPSTATTQPTNVLTTSFAPVSHTHSEYAAATHNHDSAYAPKSHTHTKSQITDFPTTMTPTAHNHAASEITSGTLGVARGGTGVTSNPSMLINLGSTTAASVFAASPRPGVTGTLPVANGGTGATTAAAALTNLGLTATAAELNYVDGVTSNIQTQLNGKAASSHTHTKSQISDFPTSMTPTAHNQAASTITAGTLAGQVKANASAAATLGTAQVRDIYAGTADLTAGSSSLTTGTIYFVYE